MALKSSKHKTCSCVSPDAFKDLSSEQRQGLEILHQREVIITEAECKRIGRSSYGYGRRKVVAQIILAKSISESLRICEICEQYQLLDRYYMKLIKVLVDVYHKEQLVTKEEAEKAAPYVWRWGEVAIIKDVSTATRIADILDKCGYDKVAQHIRVLMEVYHKEQLFTKEEAKKAAPNIWRWRAVAVTKDVTATQIADILDKYGFNDVARHIRVLVDVCHKEQLVTKEKAEKVASDVQRWEWRWKDVAVTKDVSSAARIADILDKHGFNDVAQHIREPSSTKSLLLSTKYDLAYSETEISKYAMSHTSVDTSISKTSPDIDSSELKSKEKATVISELDITSKKESYVGELNVTEEVQSNLTHTLKTFELLFHDMSHEGVLSRNCWLPFGYHSITVDRRGGTYDFCSDGLTKLTVPRNAVRGETAEIRCAIIGKGPFQLPPNYQLGSFIVYVHYNPVEITTPVTLSLPTWYGGDVVPGEPPPDGLSFAVAPHTLGLRDNLYTFQLIDRGEFRHSRGHDVSIDGHSSLFTIVFKEGAKSLYLATHLMVKNNAEETTHNVFVTYASPTWSKILEDVHNKAEIKGNKKIEFENPPSGKLVGGVKETKGNGWAVTITESPELHQTEVSYEVCGYTTAKYLKDAVKQRLYPPKLTFKVANTISRGEQTTPKYVDFTVRGADRPLQFSACVKERISDPSSPNPPPPSLYMDGPPPRQSYRHVKVKDILKSFKWRDLSKDIKDMLTIHRLKIMEWDYDLIDSACNASITANLNQGNPDDAATTLIEYFGKNHDGDALLKFCKFLRDEAKEAGEAPRLKDLAGKIERAVKAKGHSGTCM